MDLDGFALPVKKLKGTDPVQTLDFSSKKLGVASAIVIASLIGVNASSLTDLNVCRNNITGDGAQQLASAVLGKQTLECFCEIPLKELRADSLTELDLQHKGVGAPGALVLAELLRTVSASLAQVLALCQHPQTHPPERSRSCCLRSSCLPHVSPTLSSTLERTGSAQRVPSRWQTPSRSTPR